MEIIYIQLFFSLTVVGLCWGLDATQHFILSCSIGSLFVFLNLMSLLWAINRLFLKKSIALAVSVIVFKWTFMGLALYYLVVIHKINAIGLLIGLTTVLPTIALWTLKQTSTLKNISSLRKGV